MKLSPEILINGQKFVQEKLGTDDTKVGRSGYVGKDFNFFFFFLDATPQ